jgi:hypothetical protein
MAKFKKDILKLVQIFFIFLSANMKGKLIKRQPCPQEDIDLASSYQFVF